MANIGSYQSMEVASTSSPTTHSLSMLNSEIDSIFYTSPTDTTFLIYSSYHCSLQTRIVFGVVKCGGSSLWVLLEVSPQE